MLGRVKFYNEEKGFGFIISDEDGKDYFVHHGEIKMERPKILDRDQQVEFEPSENEKGLLAKDVKIKE